MNRVHVRDAEPAGGEHLALVGRLASGRRSHHCGARCVDHALDVAAEALLHHESRAGDVDLEQALRVLEASRGHAGTVEDPPSALHRPSNAAAVTDLELEPAAVEIRDRGVGRSLLHAQRDVVALCDQEVGDVGADEARRAGDEDLRQASAD